MCESPNYSALVAITISSYTRAYGLAEAFRRLRRHALNWPAGVRNRIFCDTKRRPRGDTLRDDRKASAVTDAPENAKPPGISAPEGSTNFGNVRPQELNLGNLGRPDRHLPRRRQ